MTERGLVAAANDNFLASFRKVAEHSPEGEARWFGSVFAFVSGLPISLFNGCVVVERADAADLAEALEWLSRWKLPQRGFVAPEFVSEASGALFDHGFSRDRDQYPGMVLRPIPEPPAPAAGITVSHVAGSDPEEYLRVCVDIGLPPPLVRQLYSPAFVSDPDVKLFVARLEGRPVGKAVVIRSACASGVYDVGTLETARRQGVGSATTWAAIQAARDWGHDMVVLQSSPMGLSLYTSMGFRTVVPYTTFTLRP